MAVMDKFSPAGCFGKGRVAPPVAYATGRKSISRL